MSSIVLLPLPPDSQENFPLLREDPERAFRLPVVLGQPSLTDLSFAHDSSRNQYYSTAMISSLLELHPNSKSKILAVASVDLYVPVLTYMFGEAQLDGTVALISTFRLHETFYGLPENEMLFRERVLKESVHELGHTFGLVHCHEFECVMHSSSAVEEVDLKKSEFCGKCWEMVKIKM